MEHIIARLLEAFERGKMSRRQESAGFKAVTMNHISYQVADYTKTRDLYSDLLGMKVSQDNGRQCYLSFGDTFLLPRNVRNGGQTPRVDHVAYTIETWEKNKAEAELKRRGMTPRPDAEDSFHVKGPRPAGGSGAVLGSASPRWQVWHVIRSLPWMRQYTHCTPSAAVKVRMIGTLRLVGLGISRPYHT
jgi:catechol 2,3-dioxygenase-like lactoylglutathione lyase family enzyme